MAVYQNYLRDRGGKLLILAIIALITQVIFTAYVRPAGEKWRAEQRALAERTPGYRPQRTLIVIIQDPEQEATIIVATWAMLLAFLRFRELKEQRALLSVGLMPR